MKQNKTEKVEHNTNTITIIIILSVIFLAGLAFIRLLEGIFIGARNISVIRMFGICITLNVMIMAFLIMSFKRVRFAPGPIGPKGNRGNKGYLGQYSSINSCSVDTSVLRSGQKKHNIRKREASYARYPAIVEPN
jgi:hypothetical protein